jgi:hypothetical protein
VPSRGGADWTVAPTLYDPPVRLQMMAVVLLAIVVVAVPLYLWRRPRSVAEPVALEGGAPAAALLTDPYTTVEADASSAPAIQLGDARVLECRDSSSKKIPSEQCDPLPAFTKTFAEAVRAAGECISQSAGPGTITYVADVGFSRRRAPVTVALPRDGRSYRGTKAVAGCAAAVRAGVSGVSIEAIPHAHARYKIALVATYPALEPGGGPLRVAPPREALRRSRISRVGSLALATFAQTGEVPRR